MQSREQERVEALTELSRAVEKLTVIGLSDLPPHATEQIANILASGVCKLRIVIEPNPFFVECVIAKQAKPEEYTRLFVIESPSEWH